jgi:hypothetical protein
MYPTLDLDGETESKTREAEESGERGQKHQLASTK